MNSKILEIDYQKIRQELDDSGVATLTNFFSAKDLSIFSEEIMKEINNIKPSSGNAKFSLKYDDIKHHTIAKWSHQNDFLEFLNNLLSGIVPYKLISNNIKLGYSILKDKGNNVPFHFDSLNILNLIIPVILPERCVSDKNHVDLFYIPNVLNFNDNYYTRIKSKIIQKFVHILPKKKLKYQIGSIHFFYGRRTLHGVEPILLDNYRVILSINVRFS